MNKILSPQKPVRTERWEAPAGGIAEIEIGPEETLTVSYELFSSMLRQMGYQHVSSTPTERRDINHERRAQSAEAPGR